MDLIQAKQQLDQLKTQKAIAESRQTQIQNELLSLTSKLKQDFNVGTIQQAKNLQQKLTEELTARLTQLGARLDELK